ncbi:MAG: T9SS type A sorting domain-containing protein [Bacteroidales bacterium]|nr:T9SS type A sorting domain-containing protein [Bacteroidales bacterium]
MKKLSLIVISVISTFFLFAQTPGTLDPDFGDAGIVLLDHNYNSQNNYIQGSAIQDDGKLVFGGWSYGIDASGYNFIRLLPDGTPDETFGTNGVVVINPGSSCEIWDVCIQEDDKIVGIGPAEDSTFSNVKMAVIRINTDGIPDDGFGINGIVEIDIEPDTNIFACSLTIQDDGKILAFGRMSSLPDFQSIICRLNQDGSMDHTFGDNGLVFFDIVDKIEHLSCIEIQDEKIIVGGNSFDEDWNVYITICRFLMDGTFDAEFGNGGIVLKDIPAQIDELSDNYFGNVCLAPDGKIIYAGFADGYLDEDFAVFRFLEDGNIDNSFGNNGMSVTDIEGKAFAQAVIVQNDGKIIAGGYRMSSLGNDADFTLVRYLENGDPDSLFGWDGTGIVTHNLSTTTPPYEDKINCISLQPDGKIIAAGYAYTDPPTFIDFAVARYNGDIGSVIEQAHTADLEYFLHPNPFTHETTLEFTLDSRSDVAIEVYDNRGIRVGTIANQSFDQGEHQLRWDGSRLTAGVYIVKMVIGDRVYMAKVVKTW